jgi:hypothetical protein
MTCSMALWIALPIRASGMTSGSFTFSTYFQWNSRGQRSAVATFEADHGAWINARVDGTVAEGSRKLAARDSPADNHDVSELSCEVCCARVHELRRGRCWGCYARWVDARPVGLGARCVTCGEKRRRYLKSIELHGAWQAMCFNCAGQLLHLAPLPETLGELRQVISRERRAIDRRVGKPDSRVFQYERRVGERRTSRADYPAVDDDMIIEVTIDGDLGFEDLTQIRELIEPDVLKAV